MEDSLLQGLRFRKVPLVFIDVGPALPGICNIRVDYQRGIRQAVQHLAALRHQKIAFITGPLTLQSAVTRKQAFENSVREIGMRVNPSLIIEGDHTIEGGMRAFSKLIERAEFLTAVMCSNDLTAIGVMRHAYERQISVPGQLSVIGFDDIRLARFVIPPLTSIRMSQTEAGRLAFKALLTEVQRHAPPQSGTEYTLSTDLVLRQSTALARTP
jgi:LacI family transcriptional regulator